MKTLILSIISTFSIAIGFTNHSAVRFTPAQTVEYHSKISLAKIKFPGEPVSSLKEVTGGTVEEVTFQDEDQFEYTLTVSKLKYLERLTTDRVQTRLIQGIETFTRENGRQTSRGEVWKFKKSRGRKHSFEGKDGNFHYRSITIDGISYTITVSTPSKSSEADNYEKKAQKFANSFRL